MAVAWPGPLFADDDVVDYEPDQVVVKLDPAAGATIADINATYGTNTLEILLGSAGIFLLQVGDGQEVEEVVTAMAGDSRLLYAEPNFTEEMPEGGPSGTWAWGGYDPDPYLDQYATALLNLAPAHAITLGDGVIVAVLDTGVQLGHPQLAGRLATSGYDFIDDDPIPDDESNDVDDDNDGLVDEGAGHGTHVAGIVSLVAPAAQIMPLRVLNSDGRGNDFTIAEAIQHARSQGATILNMSLGTPAASELLADILADAVAEGVVVVAAAGNLNSYTEQYPAADPYALAVTSVDPGKVKSPFASYGPWVDIAAPGRSITSTFPLDGYAQWSGTSMATGFISGQAALLRAVQPDLSPADISWLIQVTSQSIDALNPDNIGLLGAGLADIGASLNLAAGVDCGPGLTLPAGADAWIEQNGPESNKGSDSTLKVKAQNEQDNFRLLIRFLLPDALPAGCQVESATLRLYAPSWTEERTLQAYRLAGDWSEYGVTWQNQPAMAGPAATTPSGSDYREWDVSNQVQAMFTAGANHGFLIRDANEGSSGAEQQFHSRENSENPPQLVIQFASGSVSPGPLLETTLISGPAQTTTDTGAEFVFSADKPDVVFACSVDGAEFMACTSPYLVTGLETGQHRFAVRATDPAGNTDLTPASLTWTITPPFLPTTVSCGQVLVTNVRVFNSLADCPGDGLVIGASGITVDLNGHTIDGTGLGVGLRNEGYTEVTIANGTIQEFDVGVRLGFEASGNTVTGLTIQYNQEIGIELDAAGDTTIGNSLLANLITNNAGGVSLGNGTHNTVAANNSLADNDNFDFYLLNAGHNRLEGNQISHSSDGAIVLENAGFNTLSGNTITGSADGALSILAGSNDNHVENNVITNGSDPGIIIADSLGNSVIANTIHGMGDAAILLARAHGNLVRGNDLRWNASGVELDGGTGNQIKSNNASHSGGTGILLENDARDNVVSLNLVGDNAADGIYVDAELLPDSSLPGNVVAFNTAAGNGGNGLVVMKAGHTLAGNVATQNSGWGIYSAEGSIDGGNNAATGNEESQQCFNLFCNGAPPPADTTPPETQIDSGPAGETSDGFATFTFSASEAGASFDCALDGGAFTICTSPHTISNLNSGTHTFQVRATDPADNVDLTPAAYSWTVVPAVDCGPPVTVNASADAWIEQNSPDNNKGDDSALKVKAQSSQDNFRLLVRFNSPAGIPPGCVLQAATLDLYASSWKNGRTLQAWRLAGNWSELGVTWNNQPATAGPAATTSSGEGHLLWNVTGQVEAMLDTGQFYGFLIRDASEGGSGSEQVFYSREQDEYQPALTLTFVPAGE